MLTMEDLGLFIYLDEQEKEHQQESIDDEADYDYNKEDDEKQNESGIR